MNPKTRIAALKTLLAVALASCVALPSTAWAAVDLAHLKLGLKQVATGFSNPLEVTNAADGSGRLFVLEQGGRVRVVKAGVVQPKPLLDVAGSISTGGERGLLGLAFSPQYKTTGRFYIYYTDHAGNVAIQRCIASDPRSDTPTISRKTVLAIGQPYPNHNGGGMQFGPDRYLYIGVGDGGSAGDPGNRAQRGSQVLGKMLRIDVGERDATATFTGTYRIPTSNPFYNKKGYRKEIWALGLRNPWRFSFDSANGNLWIGDVGQNKYEEVDFQKASSRGGQDYGWHVWEGNHRYTTSPKNVSKKGFTFPIVEYSHPGGECVTGGYVYRGTAYPALSGTYLYADYIKGWIGGVRRFSASGAALKTPQRARLLSTGAMISSFGTDEANELYACDWSGGAIYRVTATTK